MYKIKSKQLLPTLVIWHLDDSESDSFSAAVTSEGDILPHLKNPEACAIFKFLAIIIHVSFCFK